MQAMLCGRPMSGAVWGDTLSAVCSDEKLTGDVGVSRCGACGQFGILKAKAAKAVKAAAPSSGPAMSAKQALEIVTMRKAVDNRLDNTSHTCELQLPL